MKRIATLLLTAILLVCGGVYVSADDEETFKVVNTDASFDVTTMPLTIDGDMATSAGAEGTDGSVWAIWEFEKAETVPGISIAFAKGNERQSYFDIQASVDGKTYTDVLMGAVSAGDTLDYELFRFDKPVEAKYVKFIGQGTSTNLWNNIADVKFLKELPAEESNSESSSGQIQIVSKLDYVCENAILLQSENRMVIAKSEVKATNPQNTEVCPQIIDGSMFVPLRFVAEQFGGVVAWDESTSTASCVVGNTVLKFVSDSNRITVNGKGKEMDIPAKLINSTFMVPVRVFAEETGLAVEWTGYYDIVILSRAALPELSAWELAEVNDRLHI